MHNFYFRFYEVPVRGRNYRNNQIEFNIMHDNRWKWRISFYSSHLPSTANIIHNHNTGYYLESLVKSPIFSVMHNSRNICILPNFSHLSSRI